VLWSRSYSLLYAIVDRCWQPSFVKNKSRDKPPKISMFLSARAITYLTLSSLSELLNSPGSEDKPPYRISISNYSDLKGGGVIEDAAKESEHHSFNALCNFFYILF